MKLIEWLGSSKTDIRSFPDQARLEAGWQLELVQRGDDPDDWKPMKAVGPGVREIRIREASGAFRIIYLAIWRTGYWCSMHPRRRRRPPHVKTLILRRND